MKLEVVQAHLQGKSWNSYCKFYAEGPAVGPATTLDASSPSVTPQAVKNKTQFRTKTRFRTSDPAFEQQFNVPLLDLMSKHSALRFFVMGWRGAGGAEELLGAETVTFDDMLAILAQLPPDESCEVPLDLREDSRRKRKSGKCAQLVLRFSPTEGETGVQPPTANGKIAAGVCTYTRAHYRRIACARAHTHARILDHPSCQSLYP